MQLGVFSWVWECIVEFNVQFNRVLDGNPSEREGRGHKVTLGSVWIGAVPTAWGTSTCTCTCTMYVVVCVRSWYKLEYVGSIGSIQAEFFYSIHACTSFNGSQDRVWKVTIRGIIIDCCTWPEAQLSPYWVDIVLPMDEV